MSRSPISVLSKTPGLLKELRTVLPQLAFHEVKSPENDAEFKNSEIIIGDFDLVGPHIYNLPKVKWYQGTWAGVDSLVPHIKPNQLPEFPITRFSGYHFGQLMAEFVIANVVNFERDLFKVRENQHKQKWDTDGKITDYRAIYDLTIGIMGLGNIGSRIGRTLHYLGAKINGYGRAANINQKEHDYVSNYYTKPTLAKFLNSCDYVVNVMPSTPETRGLLNGDVLESCKEKGTIFINIGRGTIIAEDSLLKALEEKWISGAILDVFEKEPLRADSPLWKLSQVFIVPHVSGQSRAKDIAQQFKENLKLFEANHRIPTAIDFTKGY